MRQETFREKLRSGYPIPTPEDTSGLLGEGTEDLRKALAGAQDADKDLDKLASRLGFGSYDTAPAAAKDNLDTYRFEFVIKAFTETGREAFRSGMVSEALILKEALTVKSGTTAPIRHDPEANAGIRLKSIKNVSSPATPTQPAVPETEKPAMATAVAKVRGEYSVRFEPTGSGTYMRLMRYSTRLGDYETVIGMLLPGTQIGKPEDFTLEHEIKVPEANTVAGYLVRLGVYDDGLRTTLDKKGMKDNNPWVAVRFLSVPVKVSRDKNASGEPDRILEDKGLCRVEMTISDRTGTRNDTLKGEYHLRIEIRNRSLQFLRFYKQKNDSTPEISVDLERGLERRELDKLLAGGTSNRTYPVKSARYTVNGKQENPSGGSLAVQLTTLKSIA